MAEPNAQAEIERLEGNLWRVEAAVPGMGLRRVMTVVKLADGGVLVHSAIALDEAGFAAIEQWGPPRFIVVPNAYHRLDCAVFKQRYPEARIVCPTAAVKRVSQVGRVDLTLDEFEGDDSVSLRHLKGTANREAVMTVRHGETATVVLCDVVFNMPHLSGLGGFILRHLTQSSGGPRVSRIARWLMVADRRQVADELVQLANTPGLSRVIVAHHRVINEQPAEALRAVAASLG